MLQIGFHSDKNNSDDKNDYCVDNILLPDDNKNNVKVVKETDAPIGMAVIIVCVLVGLSLTGVAVFIVYRCRNR